MSDHANLLPTCTPEEMGVPSQAIIDYMQAINQQRLALHSVMMVRHGHIIFESYYKPMHAGFRHRLYSCSKSFVSCAIGLLESQGLLHLDDKAISFFPDKAPADPHPWLRDMTIRDLLRMATCYETGASYRPADPDWEATFFTAQVSHAPGAVFSYCTTATTMLCMIIKRVTGMEFTQVLRPIFDELGISPDLYCIQTPCGHEWGGSGVMATAREFAAFANLCMHYGEHNGRQLLPREYMMQATSRQIDNSVDAAQLDGAMGYGYQFWVTSHGGFMFNGMGGQFGLCLPHKDFMLITTGYEELNSKGMSTVFTALWQLVYPRLHDAPLPQDRQANDRLHALADSLELVRPDGDVTSPITSQINDATYTFAPNSMGIDRMSFHFESDFGEMLYTTSRGSHTLRFGLGRQVAWPFPENHYNGVRIGHPLGRGLNCQISAAWMMPNQLMIFCHVIDMHLAQLRIAVTFHDDAVTLHTAKHAEFILQEYDGFATGTI